jgi:hypothetical protein
MATWSDVRRLALALPDTKETTFFGNRAWAVGGKPFAWERPLGVSDRKALGAAAPDGPILAVSTADLDMKDVLLASAPKVFFTMQHFSGYPAVLIELPKITLKNLSEVLEEAWLARAPKRAQAALLRDR